MSSSSDANHAARHSLAGGLRGLVVAAACDALAGGEGAWRRRVDG